jgi:hypothetical protein
VTDVSRRADSDLSSTSLGELEQELERVNDEIRESSSPQGLATAQTEARAIRKIAVLAGHRRQLLAEIESRRAALAAWRADQHQFDELTHGDD